MPKTTKSYRTAVETLRSDPSADFELVDRDATRSFYTHRSVWLEDDELMMAHPTDPRGLDIAAPRDGRYQRRYQKNTPGRGA